jgi:hypothetical protein
MHELRYGTSAPQERAEIVSRAPSRCHAQAAAGDDPRRSTQAAGPASNGKRQVWNWLRPTPTLRRVELCRN